jgi:hypothetical protein
VAYLKLGGPCSLQPASLYVMLFPFDYMFMLDVTKYLNATGGLIVGHSIISLGVLDSYLMSCFWPARTQYT